MSERREELCSPAPNDMELAPTRHRETALALSEMLKKSNGGKDHVFHYGLLRQRRRDRRI